MAQAYTALANDGVFTYSRSYSMVKDRSGKIILDNQPRTVQAFTQNTARTMTYMLNNAATYGTGSESRLDNMPVAGKTGTTSANAVLHLRRLDRLRHARAYVLLRQPRNSDLAEGHGLRARGS